MTHTHFKLVCHYCGTVINQCRCIQDKATVRGTCVPCAAKIAENPTMTLPLPAATPEPEPQPGREDIYPLVIADIQARVAAGREKYGTVLQSHNGRDALMDAYQEAIDLVMYLRQAIAERKVR